MRFKKLALISIPSTLIGGAVGIGKAIMGYGVWSIVAFQLVTRATYTVQVWIHSKAPKLVYDGKRAKELFSFGSKLMVSGIIHTIYQNIYIVVIGKYFQINNLGYYQKSNNLVQYNTGVFTAALSAITFPALASIKVKNEKL